MAVTGQSTWLIRDRASPAWLKQKRREVTRSSQGGRRTERGSPARKRGTVPSVPGSLSGCLAWCDAPPSVPPSSMRDGNDAMDAQMLHP